MDATDACGWTPLHYAAADGKLEAVRTLLSHGATLIARSQHHNLRSELLPTGLTPLHLAAYSGSLPVAKAILREYVSPLPGHKRILNCLHFSSPTHPAIALDLRSSMPGQTWCRPKPRISALRSCCDAEGGRTLTRASC